MDYANNRKSLFNETSISPALVSQVRRVKLHPTARKGKKKKKKKKKKKEEQVEQEEDNDGEEEEEDQDQGEEKDQEKARRNGEAKKAVEKNKERKWEKISLALSVQSIALKEYCKCKWSVPVQMCSQYACSWWLSTHLIEKWLNEWLRL